MAMRVLFRDVCPGGEQIHIKDTLLRGQYRTFAHTHDFYEFFVIRRGCVRHIVNGDTVELAEGQLSLTGPQDTHCYQVSPACEEAAFTNVAVPAAQFAQATGALPLRSVARWGSTPPLLDETPAWFQSKLDSLWGRLDRQQGDLSLQTTVAAMLLSDVLGLLAASRGRPESEPRMPPWLRRALGELERPEVYLAGLHRFVSLCGKSQAYVTRTTRHCLGLTPTELVNSVRLREAGRLLRDTEEPVLSVVLQSGFGNMSHFLSRFRRLHGCSPREYRRRHRMVVDPVQPGNRAS
jgi:AraC family cel operon transcriptional repressor